MSEEEQIRQIVRDADAVASTAQTYDAPGGPISRLTVTVHFGFNGLHAAHTGGSPQEPLGPSYASYCEDVYDLIRTDAGREDTALAALAPAGFEHDYRVVMGSYHTDADWVPTGELHAAPTAIPTDTGIETLAELYSRLENGGEVVVAGEDRDRCRRHTIHFFDALRQRHATDFDILPGPSYTP
ncbi:MAG: hypothetical protein SVW02_00355 [Candidatus Nanohaloarchaea archaeon]|nr:hypothetical protein [Candidatus Nanohaloarchaea archaeon]